ncbi:MAG: hypothetical protein KY445_00520 [Armatimonadetes bacterium]|nr:hypothetical protein [Armatimonadota bacterium]
MILTIVGITAGTIAAVALHILFRRLREHALVPFAIIGWLLAVLAVLSAALLTQVYLSIRTDPFASMAPFWGMLAAMLGILLVVCAGISLVHWQKLKISWFKAFGVLMSEAGVALLIALFLNQIHFSIADVLRGGSTDTRQILDSFDQSRQFMAFFDLALIVVLICSELFGHFIYRQRTLLLANPSATL